MADDSKRRLDSSLETLRIEFGHYRGSSHWYDPMSILDSSVTSTTGVWGLDKDQYENFCWHSVTMGGEPAEELLAIRYFLPRVAFDLSFSNASPWCDEHLAALLNRYSWRTWPDTECKAIEEWFLALIEFSAIQNDWRGAVIANYAAICGIELDDFFRYFLDRQPQNAIRWFAQCIEYHWVSLLQSGWPCDWQGYWGQEVRDVLLAVPLIAFLLKRPSLALLEQEFFDNSENGLSSLCSLAIEHAEDCIRYGNLHPGSPLAQAMAGG